MADRYQHEDRYQRDRYGRDDRGFVARAGDEVRSWFGDEEAARRRRLDEERERWSGPRWRGERGYGERHDFDEDWRSRSSSRDYSGISYGLSGGHRDDARISPGGGGLESGYLGYRRGEYVPPQYRPEVPAREPARNEGRREYSTEWWRVPGPHAGRGPRGYQRSDERIREELNERLTAHGLIDASDIECQVQNGIVTLAGYVETRVEKRAAEDLAEDIAGVHEVHNQLRLRSNAETDRAAATTDPGRSRARS